MKKMLRNVVYCWLLFCAAINAEARGVELYVSDIEYYWNTITKSCTKTKFKDKSVVIKDYQNGILIINKQYTNDAGVYTWLVGEDKDDSYSVNVFLSYGECKVYEKAVVQKQEITDWSYYVKLKDPAEKK